MPPPKDRDYGASHYYAANMFGEQPRIAPRRKPRKTPDERRLPGILANLKKLTGFGLPKETPELAEESDSEEEELLDEEVVFDDSTPPVKDE